MTGDEAADHSPERERGTRERGTERPSHAPFPVPSSPFPSSDRSDRYCIIGAGPSGLGAARALAEAGIPFEVVERHGDVGGIWDMENECTPMYETVHFMSSKTQSAFDGFPMPAHYPDYPGWRQIRDYLRAFARHFDLYRHVRFHTRVDRVAPAGAFWDVRLAGGGARRYRGVVLAVGHQWDPVVPSYPGSFDGESYHAFRYRSPDELAGKRVLVVGGGNSACDVACDAAVRAERAFISMRRGYHVLPTHVFGKPIDAFFRSGPHIPPRIGQPLLAVLLRLLVGDLRRYGLPRPDHKVLESHPIVNSQLLHYLSHGDLTPKPDVAVLGGDRVRFTDGSEEAIDLIVYATGYRATIPCLEPGLLCAADDRPDLFLNIFPRRHPSLFLVGHFETDGGAYPVISRQARLIAAVIRAAESTPPSAARFAQLKAGPPPDLSGGVRHIQTQRHAYYVQYDEYARYLDRLVKSLC